MPSFAPFDFERSGRLPDGTEVTLAFSLAFVQSPAMPEVAFFVRENHAPRAPFGNPRINRIPMARRALLRFTWPPVPEREAAFVAKMFDGEIGPLPEVGSGWPMAPPRSSGF